MDEVSEGWLQEERFRAFLADCVGLKFKINHGEASTNPDVIIEWEKDKDGTLVPVEVHPPIYPSGFYSHPDLVWFTNVLAKRLVPNVAKHLDLIGVGHNTQGNVAAAAAYAAMSGIDMADTVPASSMPVLVTILDQLRAHPIELRSLVSNSTDSPVGYAYTSLVRWLNEQAGYSGRVDAVDELDGALESDHSTPICDPMHVYRERNLSEAIAYTTGALRPWTPPHLHQAIDVLVHWFAYCPPAQRSKEGVAIEDAVCRYRHIAAAFLRCRPQQVHPAAAEHVRAIATIVWGHRNNEDETSLLRHAIAQSANPKDRAGLSRALQAYRTTISSHRLAA